MCHMVKLDIRCKILQSFAEKGLIKMMRVIGKTY